MPALLLVLAEIGELISAFGAYLIVAVLLVWMIGVLAYVLSHVPVIGDQIASTLRDWQGSLQAGAQAQLNSQVKALTDTIDFISGTVQAFIREVTDTATWLGGQLSAIGSAALEGLQALQTGLQSAAAAVTHLIQQAATLAAQIASGAAALANALARIVPDLIARAISQAVGAVTDTIHGVQVTLQHAISQAVAQFDAELAHAQTVFGQAIDGIRAQLNAGLQNLRHTIDGEIAHVRADVGQSIDGLTGTIQGVETQIGAWVGPITIAAAIEGVITEVGRIARCHDPMCSYLTPQLSSLNEIAELAQLVAIGELVALAVQHPEQARSEVLGLVDGARGMVQTVFADLTGLQL